MSVNDQPPTHREETHLAISQVSDDQDDWGIGQLDGLGFPAMISAGIALRGNLHILTPVLSHK